MSGNDFSRCFGRNRFGLPRWTIIHGQSMGGHIAIASLELHPDVYQGALIECGVIDGVGLTDWPYAYTGAAECFSGLPLLDLPRPEFGTLANGTWLGLMGEPGYYTFEISESWFQETLTPLFAGRESWESYSSANQHVSANQFRCLGQETGGRDSWLEPSPCPRTWAAEHRRHRFQGRQCAKTRTLAKLRDRTALWALSSRCLKPEHRPGSWRQRCLNATLGFKLYPTQWDWLNLIGIIPRIHRVQIRMMELSSFAQS